MTVPLRHAGLGPFISSAGNVYFFGRDSVNTGQVEPHKATTTSSVNIAASGDDQHIGKTGASYSPTTSNTINTTNATVTVQRTLSAGLYSTFNGLLRFDTSGIPDGAQITGATLRLCVNVPANVDGRNLTLASVREPVHIPTGASEGSLEPSARASYTHERRYKRSDIARVPDPAQAPT